MFTVANRIATRWSGPQNQVVTTLEIVDCESPHDAEVLGSTSMASLQVAAAEHERAPREEFWDDRARMRCRHVAADYLGAPLPRDIRYEFLRDDFAPTGPGGSSDGRGRATCLAMAPTETKAAGSLRTR